ncbi:MAG: isoleucine--tRNA ligase, partial [Bacillota bacterium]|nr:isoleucine--tRNA ligase [Bacillota bacterium]
MYLELEKNSPEKQTGKYWEERDLQKRIYEHREGGPKYVFYEGPPTANGKPGIHHVISRALKDSVLRYKTMKGYQIRRKAGWDTHGLPVELEVEKKLGFKNKQQIEEFGIEKFNRLCRESVWEYKDLWREMTSKMAYMVDLDHPYVTLDTDYIESVWWLLSEFYHKGFMYEGYKVSPYCPRCGTGLASHEVALGYQEIKTTSVYVKFKRKDADEYFLVWTTTPWTLPSNIALAVNPNYDYARVSHRGEILYIEKGLAEKVLEGEYEILSTHKGSELEGMEYEQILPYVKPEGKAFVVALADYVTAEDGTGIVHTAPAFGEDDYKTVQRNNLAFVQPVDLEGKFTETPWKGKFVIDADPDIIAELHAQGKLYKRQKIDHNYPHCWRCSTPLLYYAKTSWYIAMSRLREQLVANNNQVNWYPDYVGEKRFGNWLSNLMDWAISRSRYWGTPLNIWTCECGAKKSIGSIEELRTHAVGELGEVDLHRPYVDDIRLRCDCGQEMRRVPDVIDVWFDSGAMPVAQYHYPFEHKELC